MRARVIFEMDEQTPEGDAVLMSLGVAFRKHCPELQTTIIPRYDVDLERCRMAHGIVATAGTAETEITEHPDSDLCIYLSPRAVAAAGRIIPATIFIIRNQVKLLAARVQVMHEAAIRSKVRRVIFPEMEMAKGILFGKNLPTASDDTFADSVGLAIGDGYMRAHAFLNASYVGTA